MLELDFSDEQPASIISTPTFIECEFEQRTPEWHRDRLGIPTGTGYSQIITTKGKPSTQSVGYMHQLLADLIAGESVSGYADFFDKSEDIKNGRELEPDACALYEFITDYEIQKRNFCFKDANKDTGVSPDGDIVGEAGGVEIKCVKGKTLIKYRLEDKVPSTYFQQMQGQMWIMGWEWCDFFAYHPKVGHFKKRLFRDEVFVGALAAAVVAFNAELAEKLSILKGHP